MKTLKKLFFGIFVLLFATIPTVNIAKAAYYYPEVYPGDVVADETLYDSVVELTITSAEDIANLKNIDFSKFTNLSSIRVVEALMLDGSVIDLETPIHSLTIHNSVIDMSTFDYDDYENVSFEIVYNVGPKIDLEGVNYEGFVNEEYKIMSPLYGIEYEDKLNQIAESIYNASDKTPQEIIRLTTLYVLEHFEYDHDDVYEVVLFDDTKDDDEVEGDIDNNANDDDQGGAENGGNDDVDGGDGAEQTEEKTMSWLGRIFEDNKGICVDYANYISILLNKLGVFTLNIWGNYHTIDESSVLEGHAWNIVYLNGKWYGLDATWTDTDKAIAELKKVGRGAFIDPDDPSLTDYERWTLSPLRYYMQDLDGDGFFAQEHEPQFTVFRLIPEQYRKNNMSIIASFKTTDENTEPKPTTDTETTTDEKKNDKDKDEDKDEVKIPNTSTGKVEEEEEEEKKDNPDTSTGSMLVVGIALVGISMCAIATRKLARKMR